jgi:hypothetical protein
MFIGCKWTGTIRLDNGLSLFKGRRGVRKSCVSIPINMFLPLWFTLDSHMALDRSHTNLFAGEMCIHFLPRNLYDDVCSVELIREQLLFFGGIMAIDPCAIHIYRLV